MRSAVAVYFTFTVHIRLLNHPSFLFISTLLRLTIDVFFFTYIVESLSNILENRFLCNVSNKPSARDFCGWGRGSLRFARGARSKSAKTRTCAGCRARPDDASAP